jgi:hypothetical protein
VKALITVFVILGAVYGVYQFAVAGYGWFQMSGAVDDAATAALPAILDRMQQGSSAVLDRGGDRYAKIREAIMKAATESNVPLRQEDVAVGIVDNMLDVRLAWAAPIVVYQGKPYVELPMSVQRRFALVRRPSF